MFLLQKTPGTDYRVTRFALHEPTGGSRPDSDSEVIPFLHFTCKKGCGVDSRLVSDPLLLLAVQTGPSHRLHASSSSFFPFPCFSCTGSGGASQEAWSDWWGFPRNLPSPYTSLCQLPRHGGTAREEPPSVLADLLLSPRDGREQVRLLMWSWKKLLRWGFRSYKNSLLLWIWDAPLDPYCCLGRAFGICEEAELQGLNCACFSSYHSKEVGKEMVTHFPYQLPYIKRVICLSGYGVAEVCNWLSAS